jgi:hypothetical protein
MQSLARFFSDNINLSFLHINLPATGWKAIAIVVLLFALVFAMANFRRHMIDWTLKGAVFGVFFGFLFALILEGFLIVGGKTALTEVLGWKNAPKPLQLVLDSGRNQLLNVLGVSTEIPESLAKEKMSTNEVIDVLQTLNPSQMSQVKALICKP